MEKTRRCLCLILERAGGIKSSPQKKTKVVTYSVKDIADEARKLQRTRQPEQLAMERNNITKRLV